MMEVDSGRFTVGVRALDEKARRDYLALFDATTGLPARALLYDRLQMALARTRRSGTAVAVLFVRPDGSTEASAVVQAAHVLRAELRVDDTVARTGPAEFVIVCHVRDAQEVRVVVRRVAQVLRTHRALRTMTVGYSVGVGNDDPGDVLLRAAHAPPLPLAEILNLRPGALPERMRSTP